jgi:hypothetical protein
MDVNDDAGICYPQPRDLGERVAIARDFAARSSYQIPLLVDGMDDAAEKAYAAWPERLYVIDEHGRVAYKGKTGPFGFEPDEVDAWLAAKP